MHSPIKLTAMLSNDESCDYNGKYIYIYNVGLTLVNIKLYTLMRN